MYLKKIKIKSQFFLIWKNLNFQITVVAGQTKLKQDEIGQIRNVQRKIIYHEYNPNTFLNDFALLILDEPFVYGPTVQKIELEENGNLQPGSDAVVVGWGASSVWGLSSNHLKEVVLPIRSDLECGVIWLQIYNKDR